MTDKRELRRQKRLKRREENRRYLSEKFRREKAVFWTYLILRIIVIATFVLCVIDGDLERSFVCVLVLVIYALPSFIERRLHIDIPSALEIIIFVFVFAAEILGELQAYFIKYPYWDTVLHTSSGFLFAAVGYSLVDLLNRSEKVKFELSPIYIAITSFCFSMTIGVLWEFIEFAADRLFLLDMQKDTVLNAISSVTLDPTNSNVAIYVDNITDMSINGQSLGLGGYLDIGLYDTMEDLFVNFIGAVIFSVIGFIEHKSGRRFLTDALGLRRMKREEEET